MSTGGGDEWMRFGNGPEDLSLITGVFIYLFYFPRALLKLSAMIKDAIK